MGVLGVQLVCTMIMTNIMSKVAPQMSVGRWLLCSTGLQYFLHPSDQQLRKGPANGKKHKKGVPDNEAFDVDLKNLNVELEKTSITETDVIQLRFYSDYQWLIDFTSCTLIVYVITELYMALGNVQEEVNLSMVWCALLMMFTLKVLFALTKQYFGSGGGDSEKAVVVLAFFCYLLIALIVLIIREERLELGLDTAYASLNASANEFMETQELHSVGLVSKMSCKAVIAVLGAVIGASFTFPGLRVGKMHSAAVLAHAASPRTVSLLHLSFLSPALVALLWVPPLSRKWLVVDTFPGQAKPLLTPDAFDILRIIAVLGTCALRLSVLPYYLQTYLDMARDRVVKLKSQAGKMSNKDLQMKVTSVFFYLCIVALQCVLPMLLCFTVALMCKTLGGLHWSALLSPRSFVGDECPIEEIHTAAPASSLVQGILSSSDATQAVADGFTSLKQMLVPEVYRGLLGFWLWWCIFVQFASNVFGVLYERYFTVS